LGSCVAVSVLTMAAESVVVTGDARLPALPTEFAALIITPLAALLSAMAPGGVLPVSLTCCSTWVDSLKLDST